MLKVKFWRIENVILMKILEQDGIERGNHKWESPNGIKICSNSRPELSKDIIFVRGDEHEYDDSVSCRECNSEEDAIIALQKYVAAVRDYNSQLKKEEKTESSEVVIAE